MANWRASGYGVLPPAVTCRPATGQTFVGAGAQNGPVVPAATSVALIGGLWLADNKWMPMRSSIAGAPEVVLPQIDACGQFEIRSICKGKNGDRLITLPPEGVRHTDYAGPSLDRPSANGPA